MERKKQNMTEEKKNYINIIEEKNRQKKKKKEISLIIRIYGKHRNHHLHINNILIKCHVVYHLQQIVQLLYISYLAVLVQ